MITRENYEEFFVLYVDNELPASTRSAVEKFVADNPDLQEELTALLQCRISPDREAGFPDKDLLFNYELPLLDYVDGELDERGRSSVEEWVRYNPRAAEELRQLQLTVSEPDPSIVCPGKESLYRGQRRRAVLLPWLRAGVAAAVLGGAALLLLARHEPTQIAASAPKKILPVVTSVGFDTLNSTKKGEGSLVKDQGSVVKGEGSVKDQGSVVNGEGALVKGEGALVNDRQVAMLAKTRDRRSQQKDIQASAKQAPIVTPAVETDVAAPDRTQVREQTQMVEQARIPTSEQTGLSTSGQTGLSTSIAAVNIPKEQSSFATQALLQQDQDNSVAEVSVAPAKNKLRGLFRKVGRAFGKTAESDNDGQREVLISAFQVALK